MATKTDNDSILVSAIKKDCFDAFNILYNRYCKSVYRFATKYFHNSEESKELVQTVFISLWEHRRSLDESGSVKNYIFRSAVNSIYNILKKKAVRRKFMLEQIQKPVEYLNPYEQIFYKDLNDQVSEVIGFLTPQQKAIYNLRTAKGLSCGEIARIMQLSVRTVENHIYRVNKVLKEKLNSEL